MLSANTIIILVIFALIIIVLFPKSRPKEKNFKCVRCKAIFEHNNRTIEAWRNKKTKFYCQACHEVWLQSQSNIGHIKETKGCFPLIVFAFLLPVAFLEIIDWLV